MRLVRLNCTFNESVAAEISDFLLNPLNLNIFVASEGLYVLAAFEYYEIERRTLT